MYDFAYQKPGSVADAVKLLRRDPEAKALAGGQTFIPVLKQRLNKPSAVVDLSKLGLSGITVDGRHDHHRRDDHARDDRRPTPTSRPRSPAWPSMASLDRRHAGAPSRHDGRLAGQQRPGRLLSRRRAGAGATIKTDRRSIAADDFFQGMFTTALEPGEMITAIEFPVPEKSAYEKFRNPASRYAMVGVFVAKGPAGVRVAITGAGQGGVFRHTEMEKALSANFSPDAIAGIKTPADGLNGDIHASAEYRAHLIGVMARRAVAAA